MIEQHIKCECGNEHNISDPKDWPDPILVIRCDYCDDAFVTHEGTTFLEAPTGDVTRVRVEGMDLNHMVVRVECTLCPNCLENVNVIDVWKTVGFKRGYTLA